MAHIDGEIVIKRPIDEVFDFVADGRNEPRYNDAMLQAEQVTDGAIGEGTRFRAVTQSNGGTAQMIIEYTAFERPRRLASTTHMAAMDIEGTLTFEAVPEGTRMHWSWEVEPRGVYRLMGPIIAQLGARQETRIWTGLKRYMEREESSASSDNHQVAGGSK